MGNVPIFSEPHEGPASGGGWISGPMIDGAPEARDSRPEYSPDSLVLDVLAVLGRAGIRINPGANVSYVAGLKAADLLQALGVRPTNAPWRGGP